MIRKKFLIPDYVLNFKCTMCTECCKRWQINFDKETVKKYDYFSTLDEDFAAMLSSIKKEKDGGAIVKFNNKVEGNREGIDLTEADVCPFLDEEGLCTIQRKYGIEALSDTCKMFPRGITLTERGYEISLTYACAAAAETLKKKLPIEFYQDPKNFSFPSLHTQYNKIGNLLERSKVGKTNYYKIEELLINIMQFRDIDIDTRLILTGMIIDKLKDGDMDGVKRYLRNIDQFFIDQFNSLPAKPVIIMGFLNNIIASKIWIDMSEINMKELFQLAYQQFNPLNNSDSQADRLLEAYNKYYRVGIEDINHIYENYFVNFIFSKKFYTHKYMDAYFLMIFFYTLIRFFTICRCLAEKRKVDENLVVAVINTIERSIGHNVTFYEDILDQIKKGGYNRLPYMISLVNLKLE
ncbi:flagellin lysine-N-methylase [Desulforamulus ruminis]|uniref:Lysine-N-methylase n=1 Tax=Desulforamulus ruminis (strain ATCC 23193 / DSM 2154 / NCIMB 8452 / DL) TaxID=696281 RepID=F6DNQ4_DESRL|nr:flagellin lysine-N-methylase [Desulforamulus ruminis]AEG59499.1 hypothetical protein Desru_1225 [Desulforamulus ruminis DSM 2154]